MFWQASCSCSRAFILGSSTLSTSSAAVIKAASIPASLACWMLNFKSCTLRSCVAVFKAASTFSLDSAAASRFFTCFNSVSVSPAEQACSKAAFSVSTLPESAACCSLVRASRFCFSTASTCSAAEISFSETSNFLAFSMAASNLATSWTWAASVSSAAARCFSFFISSALARSSSVGPSGTTTSSFFSAGSCTVMVVSSVLATASMSPFSPRPVGVFAFFFFVVPFSAVLSPSASFFLVFFFATASEVVDSSPSLTFFLIFFFAVASESVGEVMAALRAEEGDRFGSESASGDSAGASVDMDSAQEAVSTSGRGSCNLPEGDAGSASSSSSSSALANLISSPCVAASTTRLEPKHRLCRCLAATAATAAPIAVLEATEVSLLSLGRVVLATAGWCGGAAAPACQLEATKASNIATGRRRPPEL
mmetsp:Transcript_133170/g.315705  ORF Transcript_133170/g.315705 Transcript_133170/m.315705 type:complete len:424 (+) Transcript_133170:161-1432(+)